MKKLVKIARRQIEEKFPFFDENWFPTPSEVSKFLEDLRNSYPDMGWVGNYTKYDMGSGWVFQILFEEDNRKEDSYGDTSGPYNIIFRLFHLTNGETYWKIPGYLASYGEPDLEYTNVHEVEEKQKVTKYWSKK